MAIEDGVATYPVIQDLQKHPQRYSFIQAVSLLESYVHDQCEPIDQISVGYHGPTALEAVRFRPHASLGFPAADLKKISVLSEENQIKFQMEVNFMGLYGAVSPLPAFYTESIIQNTDGESNRRDFFDLFHHRAISLNYRIATKYLLSKRIERGLNDIVSNWLFSLIGLSGVSTLNKPPLKRLHRLLANIGLLATQNRSGAMISRVVSHYFGDIPVRVEEFVEREVYINDDQLVRLGRQMCTLGEDVTIGHTLKDRAGKFRLWIGALGFERFSEFLPSEEEFEELVALIRYLLQDPLSFDVGLVLADDEVPEFTLAKDDPCRLGWSTWLGHPSKDEKQIILKAN